MVLPFRSSVPVAARLQPPGADQATRISGPWRLNKDLSSKPPAPAEVPATTGSDPNGGAGGRRTPGGGYGGRGGMGGGMGGGGFGGGFGGRGGNRSGTTAAQATEMRSLFRELTAAPAGLTIVASTEMVETTDSDGLIR